MLTIVRAVIQDFLPGKMWREVETQEFPQSLGIFAGNAFAKGKGPGINRGLTITLFSRLLPLFNFTASSPETELFPAGNLKET